MSNKILHEQLLAMTASGVTRFPVIKPEEVQTAPQETFPNPLPKSQVLSKREVSDILTCTACALSQNRTRVVCNSKATQAVYFVISSYPEPEDEAATQTFSSANMLSGLIMRLLEKLSIYKDSYCTYAIKCTPKRSLPNDSLIKCSQNLLTEIELVNPKTIICFGELALQSLLLHVQDFKAPIGFQCGDLGILSIANEKRRLVVVPSALELEHHPSFRAHVWNFLQKVTSF